MALEKETLGFWEKIIKMTDKYGYWKLTKVVMFVVFTITMIYLGKNFGENYDFEHQKEIISQVMSEKDEMKSFTHSKEMVLRNNIKPYVSNLLKNTLSEMNADRAFVIELHNGSNNTSGLPFIHCTMTYEEDAIGIEPIGEDYQNLSLSRFDFPDYLHEHDLWIGDVDTFASIDSKAASRMKNNDVTFLVIGTIRSAANEIGYFGFTYCKGKEHKDKKVIIEFMFNAVQKLSKLLDKDITDVKDEMVQSENN